ncbi:hypothetical protein SDC9_192245 [bioreactor metagenome]|uniref:Uncharacterized protein n=1 Tax=bioreactor metagenome TaxID=1076179 RepID=A0A645I0J8_9ZZZZ
MEAVEGGVEIVRADLDLCRRLSGEGRVSILRKDRGEQIFSGGFYAADRPAVHDPLFFFSVLGAESGDKRRRGGFLYCGGFVV